MKRKLSQNVLLNYSSTQYVVIAVLMFYFQYLYELLRSYGVSLGLTYIPASSVPTLGWALKNFSFYHLTALLLILINVSITFPNKKFKKLPNLHYISMLGLLVFIGFITATALLNPFSHFELFGYINLNTTVIVYSCVALYLLWLLRNGNFLKTMLIVALPILTISHLWEMPFGIEYYVYSGSHLYYCSLGIFNLLISPIFWFYTARKIYKAFIQEHLWLTLSLILLITSLTTITMVNNLLGVYWLPIGFTLRLTYALLLVFLPFHYYKKTEVTKTRMGKRCEEDKEPWTPYGARYHQSFSQTKKIRRK